MPAEYTSPNNQSSSAQPQLKSLEDATMVFLMPISAKANIESVLDTAASIRFNMKNSALVIGVEEGCDSLLEALKPFATDFSLLEIKLPIKRDMNGKNTKGKLFLKTGAMFKHALENSKAEVICRIDDDALVVRPGFEEDVKNVLEANPKCGGFGTVRHGFEGPVRKFPKRRGLYESTALWFKDPAVAKIMAPLVFGALFRGNPLGLIVAGMCACYTRACLQDINDSGLFDKAEMMRSMSQDDLIMSCATICAGYQLCDFPQEANPFGFHWKTLPASPERLWDSGVKVVHSVRDQEFGTEAEIRKFFKDNYTQLDSD